MKSVVIFYFDKKEKFELYYMMWGLIV